MFTEKQIERMLGKLERFEVMLEPRIFNKVAEVGARAYETTERLHKLPDDSLFTPVGAARAHTAGSRPSSPCPPSVTARISL